MDKKILAGVVVVALVIIVAAAIVLTQDNGPHKEKPGTYDNPAMVLIDANVNPVLEVYGNVNEDSVIDKKDYDLLKTAIKDGKTPNYKYADANFDGVVNEEDLEYIEEIINATYENPVVVKLLNRYNKGDYYTEVSIPTKSVGMSASANLILMMKYLGITEPIKAVSYNGGIDASLYPEYQYLFVDLDKKFDVGGSFVYRVGDSAMYVAKELFLDHVTKDGVTCFITADNSSYLTYSSSKGYGMTEKEMNELGIDVLRIGSAYVDPSAYLSNLATLSFVMGADASKLDAIASWTEKTVKEINDKLNNTVGEGSVKEINIAVSSANQYIEKSDGTIDTYNYVSSKTSDYTQAVMAAGGHFALDAYDFGTSTSSKKYTDFGKWLADYDIDKIICLKTGSGFSYLKGEATTTDAGKTAMIGCMKAFKDTEAYYNNNVIVIAGDMPIILRTVYAAVALYPDWFSESWADKLYQEYTTKFLGMDKSDVKDGKFIIHMEDVGLQGH